MSNDKFNETLNEWLHEAAKDIAQEIDTAVEKRLFVSLDNGELVPITDITDDVGLIKAKLADRVIEELTQRYFGELAEMLGKVEG